MTPVRLTVPLSCAWTVDSVRSRVGHVNSRLQLGRVAGGGDSVGSETRAGRDVSCAAFEIVIVDVVRKAVRYHVCHVCDCTNFGGSTLCTTSALARILRGKSRIDPILYPFTVSTLFSHTHLCRQSRAGQCGRVADPCLHWLALHRPLRQTRRRAVRRLHPLRGFRVASAGLAGVGGGALRLDGFYPSRCIPPSARSSKKLSPRPISGGLCAIVVPAVQVVGSTQAPRRCCVSAFANDTSDCRA